MSETNPGTKVITEESTQKDVKLWIGRAAMFTNGFIMLTPHRIALSCSPHLVKRFHLPPDVVPLFIYKIHNPMELASLSSTFLANVLTWVNEATINSMYLKRYLSIIFLWLMALCSVMTYFLFITGDDFGYLDYFYWNMIFTFINGFASSFGFGVNFNTSMYGAGLPTSGGFTFVMHFLYKWLYKKYYWEDYDYTLVVYQIKVTMGLLFFACFLWTGNELLHVILPYYEEWYVKIKVLIANGIRSPADADVRRIANVMNNAESTKATWFQNDTIQKAIEEIVSGDKDKVVKYGGLVALVIFGVAGITTVIYGIILCSTLDVHDEDLLVTIRNLGILFALTSLIPIFFGVVIANHREKASLGGYTNESDKTVLKTNLSNDIGTFGTGTDGTQTHARKFARANFVASVGIGVLMIVFAAVVLFSVILFKKDKDSLIPVIFLGSFITAVTICVFAGVIIVGSITIIGETAGKASLVNEKGRTNGYLLLSFLGVSITTGSFMIFIKRMPYINYIIWGFLIYGLSAAIISAVNVDGGIQKLFTDGKDWSPILMLGFSMGFVYAFYPSISPYQLVDDEELGKDIELWTLLISSIPTFLIALLDIIPSAKGPGGNSKFDNWSADDRKYWHCSHSAFPPYFFCIFLFFSVMHFLEGRIGKFFKGHSVRTALLAVSFNTIEEFLEAVGFAGGGMQAGGFTGPITQFNVLFMFVILNVSMFTSYLKQTLLKLTIL